jgi:hypothetical protein
MVSSEMGEIHCVPSLIGNLERFHRTLEALEELVEFTRMHVPPLDDQQRVLDALLQKQSIEINADQRATALKAMKEYFEGSSEIAKNEPPESTVKSRIGLLVEAFFDRLKFAEIEPRVAVQLLLTYPETIMRRPRAEMLYSSLLVTTVGACEVFLGDLMRTYLRAHPEAMNSHEAAFQYSEVARFDDMEAFRRHSIDRLVDGTLRRGSFDDWMKWLEKKLGISYGDTTNRCAEIQETFQRRHVHVHNDGRVSGLYVERAPAAYKSATVGEYLSVSDTYLQNAVEWLRAFSDVLTALVARVLTRRDPTALEDFESWMTVRIYNYLVANRCDVVMEISSKLLGGFRDESCRYTTQVNQWIARRDTGDKSYLDEVKVWSTSALHPRFALAKEALLGNVDKAAKLARGLLDQKDSKFTVQLYRQWPLLRDVREKYPELSSNDVSVESSQQSSKGSA